MLAAKSSVRPGLARPVDQPLAVEEAERQLLVVAGRAHRHRQRRAVDADLERLLDRDLVAPAVADGTDAIMPWRIGAVRSVAPASAGVNAGCLGHRPHVDGDDLVLGAARC